MSRPAICVVTLPELFVALVSLPPDTHAVLVTGRAAALVTVTVMVSALKLPVPTSDCDVLAVTIQRPPACCVLALQPVPAADTKVMPAGSVSTTVTVP
jgi:hypothetical protein